jgi:hypothetical protein
MALMLCVDQVPIVKPHDRDVLPRHHSILALHRSCEASRRCSPHPERGTRPPVEVRFEAYC